VVGGIIPDEDAAWLRERGVAAVFTPKDYDVAVILDNVVDLLAS
jgi:(2R)-ethylmalonyl-CoA mutase